jgi:16S rRNA (cytosine967-C5)-methyltransferase
LKTTIGDFKRMLDELEVGWTDSPYLPEFLRVTKLQPVLAAGLLRSGVAAVQDESAGLVSRVLHPKPGEFIIDACAAPGGKLVHAGILMKNRGRLVGVDVNGKRLDSGLAVAHRHGLSIVEAVEADYRTLSPTDSLPEADAVLLDAPCSGLGVLTRRPDLRWRRTEESLVETTALQDQLLDAAARFVKPGGRLVYATCTIEPEENEGRVDAFLRRHPEFLLDPISGDLVPSVEAGGFMVTLPHIHEIDGAFAARLVRENAKRETLR